MTARCDGIGKGLHSTEHVSKLEPAIEELMQRLDNSHESSIFCIHRFITSRYNLVAHLEEHNSGVLVVALDGRRSDRSLGLGDISRRLENKDEDCIVM